MKAINPYLNFAGNTEEAFQFYQAVFGGELLGLQRFSDTPFGEQLPVEERGKIMHVALKIGKDNMIMATDTLPSLGQTCTAGNNVHLCLSPESEEETATIFNKLSEGGEVTMPLGKQDWNAYFGMVTDKFGISWMLNYEYGA